MSIPASILPIGGAVLGSLAAKTFTRLADGLSFKSQLLGTSHGEEEDVSASAEPSVSLNLTEALPQFVSALRDRFQAAGIDFSQPLWLKEDGNGGIIVDGDHPDRLIIEQLLSQDPNLVAEFQAIARAATERRQSLPSGIDNAFGEFRLNLTAGAAAIRFE